MKKFLKNVFAACALCAAFSCAASPVKVIFDTDMGNDVDDVLALMMLLNYAEAGKAQIAAILINKDNKWAPVFTDIVAEYHGARGIPMGKVRGGATREDGRFVKKFSAETNFDGSFKYARRVCENSEIADPTALIGKVLNESADGGVVYISIGFSTNLARFLESKGGAELFAKKVKLLSIMAGNFSEKALREPKKAAPEYNVVKDVRAFRTVLEKCKVPVVFSGFEVGEKICYPHQAIDARFGPEDPAARAYREWEKGSPEASDYPKTSRHDRPCWDLTSVLYVFEPELFGISESGTAAVDERGVTYFTPSKNGKHRYLKLKKDSTAGIVNRLVETSAPLHAPKNCSN